MKQPWDWTEEDLLKLAEEATTESLILQFQPCSAVERTEERKLEIGRDVSALANSAGGTLVYGVLKRDDRAIGLDEGFDPRSIKPEWLEQVIHSEVQPRLEGLRIASVALSGERKGRAAYIVHVPQSLRGPHQASDHRYYRRFRSQSVPMEDYEVRDILRRAAGPDLRLGFAVERQAAGPRPGPRPGRKAAPEGPASVAPCELVTVVTNHSPVMATYANFRVWLSSDLEPQPGVFTLYAPQRAIRVKGKQLNVIGFARNWDGTREMPVWQDLPVRTGGIAISVRTEPSTRYLIVWETRAPEMETRVGAADLIATSARITVRPFASAEWDGDTLWVEEA